MNKGLGIILIAFLLLSAPAQAQEQEYATVQDVGTLEEHPESELNGLNDAGVAVGAAYGESEERGFLYRNGTLQALGTLGGANSWAFDINAEGQIAGYAETAEGNPHAVLWMDGTPTDLGTLGGPTSQAIRVNASGQAVGFSDTAEGEEAPYHAFLWQAGGMTDLGTLGGRDSRANGINDQGQVVGRARDADGVWHAFLWEDGEMTDLGTLPDFTAAVAIRINNAGQVVGWAETESAGEGPIRPVLWEDGTPVDLGTLGGEQGRAFGLNDAGQVVGRGLNADGAARAFLWQGGEMTDLNSLVDPALGWVLESAYAINREGRIAGYGTLNGEGRGFLLTLPEAANAQAGAGGSSGEIAATVPVGREPMLLTAAAGSIWVANNGEGTISRIDPATNEVTATIPIGTSIGGPHEVASHGEAIWFTNNPGLSVDRIDPQSNEVVASVALGVEPYRLSVGENDIWITTNRNNTVMRIDPESATVTATLEIPSPGGIVRTEDAVWTVSKRDNKVFRIDPDTNRIAATIELQDPPSSTPCGWCGETVAVGEGSVWVTLIDRVARIDPRTNAVTMIPVGLEAKGLAVGEGEVWVLLTTEGKAVKIDPQTNQVAGELSVPASFGIIIHGDDLWMANFEQDTVSRRRFE